MVAKMQNNIDGYDGEGYAGRKQKICGTTEMAKWVERTVTDWVIIDRKQLLT